MKVYTETEYDRLYKKTLEYEQIESNTRGFDEIITAKSQWSAEQYRYANLSSGIELDIVDEQMFLDRNELVEHNNYQSIVAKFYLSGYHSVISPGVKGIAAEYTETKGQNYLFYLPDIEEIEQSWAGDRLKMLRIEIDLDIIRRFVTELNTVPKQLQALIENDKPQRFHSALGDITQEMQTIIEQIWHHPYQGAIARMYLEGKALELMAMQLSLLTTNCDRQTTHTRLKPKEIDCIYDARKILLNDLDNPPNIKALAKTVGMSDRKLQQGFKEIYGTTVFNYLHNYRLQQAQLMLREGDLSVATVANNIGYTHLGHFSAAFKRKFGMTPRDCSGENY
ncbi:AraC family transcriptional regulator [Pleurocapsa sp. CCALA 161]|uniref:helix-turn-helix transcriptional regulator n=1 Tax=Pleurocapsa sp. CCALA 161 TaxID=2107688 RepID=UPI000D0657E6|nr:AraC family transcriptional regulator [Pleurocapsa sp. CCALA 161]PSB09513.1 AraC family transcriptional regulator [Pleurocapsa sp. CCALA 161]